MSEALQPGWPPDGQQGSIIGIGADGWACVLLWHPAYKETPASWWGLRVADYGDGRRIPECFRRAPETEDRVLAWMPAPRLDQQNLRGGTGGESR